MGLLSERDWILRLAKQIADFLARALKLADGGKREEAQALLKDGCLRALGMEFEALAFVDGTTLVELLREPHKVVAFAQLLDTMGQVELEGDKAVARFRHALEVLEALASARTMTSEGAALRARVLAHLH